MARDNNLSEKIIMMFKNSSLGLTDEELARHLNKEVNAIKAARCKHLAKGDIIWDGTTRLATSGRHQKVFKHKEYLGKSSKRTTSDDHPKYSTGSVIRRTGKPREDGLNRTDKIRDAIAGLLSIIQLIETSLPRTTQKRRK